MITLLYRAETVGPVCRRVAEGVKNLKAKHENEVTSPFKGTILRWGSRWRGTATIEINTAEAVGVARDKLTTRARLSGLCPATWSVERDVKIPCVIRPQHHHGGARFYVCRTIPEVRTAIRRCGRGWYASALINKTKEYRIFILYGYVVCVSERFPQKPDDIAWNLALGGRMVNLDRKEWPCSAIRFAIKANWLVGLDWGAVDVALEKENNAPMVFEVNTAPGLRNHYTISQIAKALSWTDINGVAEKREPKTGDTWKKLLHPALR